MTKINVEGAFSVTRALNPQRFINSWAKARSSLGEEPINSANCGSESGVRDLENARFVERFA